MPKGLLFIFLLTLMSFDVPKLQKIKLKEQGITISVPKGWRPMDGMDFTERYPSVRAPLAAYTNEERLIDFSVNVSATRWPDRDADVAKSFFRASIFSMFDRVEIIREGTQVIHGKSYIFFEFKSRINGSRKEESLREPVLRYTYIQYLLGPERALVFSFNCPQRLMPEWQETAGVMMKNVVVQ